VQYNRSKGTECFGGTSCRHLQGRKITENGKNRKNAGKEKGTTALRKSIGIRRLNYTGPLKDLEFDVSEECAAYIFRMGYDGLEKMARI
jgi:hypothetical protein